MAVTDSYARKYRPSTMADYIGNAGVKETVMRYLRSKKPQTILLTGNTGCGKTTIARLIIKEYLCENRNPETGACGVCDACRAVDEYIRTGDTDMLPDISEIDIGASSGKRDVESFLESMDYPAIGGEWKIYVLDECHALSNSAQALLLKKLEEPPENVLLIFCTTNPEKLLDTIRNRCQLQLQISKPGLKDLVSYLKRICLSENKDYDFEGLRLISTRSDFVVRDAANNLERVINTRGNAKVESVSAEFNEVSDKIIFEFYRSYVEDDFYGYASVLYQIKTGYDFAQFLSALVSFTVRGIYILNGIDLEGLSEEEIIAYKKLFKKFSPSELSRILSDLKKMNVGSVEANLFAFIYHKRDEERVAVENYSPAVKNEEDVISGEKKFRNMVLQQKELLKMQKGAESLEEKTAPVSLKDMASLFQMNKVKK